MLDDCEGGVGLKARAKLRDTSANVRFVGCKKGCSLAHGGVEAGIMYAALAALRGGKRHKRVCLFAWNQSMPRETVPAS